MGRTNRQGLGIIQCYETLRLTAYLCPAGKWTIGWGHTGPDVYPGLTITADEADRLFQADLERFESAVDELLAVEVTGNQFRALVCFAYNVGEGDDGLAGSPLCAS